MFIQSSHTKVVALKAAGQKTLRIFPGPNQLSDDVELDAYTKGNIAAAAQVSKHMKVVKKEELSGDEVKQAQLVKKRNDELNKAKKVIKVQKKELKASEKELKELQATVKALTEKIEALKPKKEKDKK